MSKKKILLIDDDEELVAISSKVLKKAGYDVTTFFTCTDGLEFLEKNPAIDLILLDVVLSDYSGLEFLAKIKSEPILKDIYVIIISGTITDSESLTKAFNLGADGYLIKPIQNRELISRIDAAFRHINTLNEIRDKEKELKKLNVSIEEQYNTQLRLNEQLKKSHLASLNLMSDLKAEIEERKKVEIQLLNIQKQLSTLIHTIPDLIWLKDVNGVYLSCNSAFEKLYGAKEAEIIGKTDYDFVDKELADSFIAYDKKSIALGKPSLNEEWVTFADDGHKALLETIKTPMYDSNGNLIGVLGIGRDITERKEIELALRRSEEKFRNLIESINEVFYTTDTNGKLTYISPNVSLLTGYSTAEVTGKTYLKFVLPKDQRKVVSHYLKQVANGVSDTSLEFRIRTKDGKIKWAGQLTHIEYDKEGNVVEYRNVARDITDRKTAEEALRISREQFKAYFNSSSVGLSVTAPDKSWIEVNQKLCDMMGYTKEELNNVTWESLTHPDDIDVNRELFIKAIGGEIDNYSLDKRFITKDGKKIYVTISTAVQRDNTGAVHHFLTSYTDITERKLAEQELIASREKLRALTARLEQVKEEERVHLSRELHDHLGQNLTGLKMEIAYFAKKIKAERFSNPDDLLIKSNEMLGLIDEMINNVRKISAQLRPDVLDYLGLIPAIEWQIGELMKRTEITAELKTEVSKIDLGILKNSSIFRIVQEAFTNIIRHAQATKVLVSIKEETDTYILEILDNGIGVNETDMSNVKSLGVIGMKERTLQFNGKLNIENAPQGGTMLTLVVPKTENIE